MLLPGQQVWVGVLTVLVLLEVLGGSEVLGQLDPRLLDHPPQLDRVEGSSTTGGEVGQLHQLQGQTLVRRVEERRNLGGRVASEDNGTKRKLPRIAEMKKKETFSRNAWSASAQDEFVAMDVLKKSSSRSRKAAAALFQEV